MSGPALVKVDADKAEALRKWAVENGYGPKAAQAPKPAPKPEPVAVEAPEPETPARVVELPDTWRVDQGECVSLLKGLPDSCVDAIVTDPPYEIGFMGKSWDSTGVAYDPKTWAECLRVLKPGGHLLAFAATRTYHRIAVAVEDAGFEIRDMVEWVYGTGFPKSMNVAKKIDEARGAEAVERPHPTNACPGGQWCECTTDNGRYSQTKHPPAYDYGSADAQKWSGWGTALKPAHEPIVLARKPLQGTVAGNVLEHGVGALNVDGCRVQGVKPATTRGAGGQHGRFNGLPAQGRIEDDGAGRWPANLILGPGAAADLDESTGPLHPPGSNGQKSHPDASSWSLGNVEQRPSYTDKGGASRFFYVAKPSRKERDAGLDGFDAKFSPTMGNGIGGKEHDPETATPKRNVHPTVKPVALMRYLCRLVTPPGGVVVDPFAGSGTTGIGATLEGFRFLGFELDADHAEIARARITHWAEGAE